MSDSLRVCKRFLLISKIKIFRKKREFVSKHANIVILWSFSSGSLEILKRYLDIFRKKFSLISFYFPFWGTINILWESIKDHIIRKSPSKLFCKLIGFKNFTKFTRKHLYQSLIFNKVADFRHNMNITLLIHLYFFIVQLTTKSKVFARFTQGVLLLTGFLVIVCILPISYLMPVVLVMVCEKTQNQTKQGFLLKGVQVEGFSSLI